MHFLCTETTRTTYVCPYGSCSLSISLSHIDIIVINLTIYIGYDGPISAGSSGASEFNAAMSSIFVILNLKHDVYAFTATSTSAVHQPATTGVESGCTLSTVDVQPSATNGRHAKYSAVTVPLLADGIQSSRTSSNTAVAATTGPFLFISYAV